MPFKSKSQWRLCRVLRSRGSNWDCEEWGKGQKYESLPERVTSSRPSKSKRRRSQSLKKRVKSRSLKKKQRSKRSGKQRK